MSIPNAAKREISPVLEVSGGQFRVGAVSPENIGPAGAGNGAAGILVQGESAEFFPGPELPRFGRDRFLRLNVHQGRGRKDFFIDGNGAARGQRDSPW